MSNSFFLSFYFKSFKKFVLLRLLCVLKNILIWQRYQKIVYSYTFLLLWRKQVCFGAFYGKRRHPWKRKVNKAKRQSKAVVKRQKLWQLLFKSREMATSNNLDGLASSSSSSVGSEATKRPTSSQETQVLDKKRLQVSYFLGCMYHLYFPRHSFSYVFIKIKSKLKNIITNT